MAVVGKFILIPLLCLHSFDCKINKKKVISYPINEGISKDEDFNHVVCSEFLKTSKLKMLKIYKDDILIYHEDITTNVRTSPQCNVDLIILYSAQGDLNEIIFNNSKKSIYIGIHPFPRKIYLSPIEHTDNLSVDNFGILIGGGYKIVPTWDN